MTTVDAMLAQRWALLAAAEAVGPFTAGHAIDDFWVQNPQIGSPIGGEVDWDGVDGGKLRPFANAVVGWDAANGARVVSE